MNKQEFIKTAKETKNINIYSINRVNKKGNKGIEITSSNQLSESTVSTQKTTVYWNMELYEIANETLYN